MDVESAENSARAQNQIFGLTTIAILTYAFLELHIY